MIYLNIIGLFLSSFDVQLSSLVSFSHCAVFVGRRKKILDFFFWNWYYKCFSPLFSGVFLNIICYGKRMEILLYLVSSCPLKSKFNSFLRTCIQFSRRLSRGKEKQ